MSSCTPLRRCTRDPRKQNTRRCCMYHPEIVLNFHNHSSISVLSCFTAVHFRLARQGWVYDGNGRRFIGTLLAK